jgi:hypothetical protein
MINGRYRLGGVLGKGGMSVVHRAWDLELRRLVAVKLYVPNADPAAGQRLREEARTLAGFSHPGLLPVYDVGIDDDRPYLVLCLVEGCNLRQCLDGGPLPAHRARSIAACLAEALAYVHGHGVIHRDVKPANVLIGDREEPYLADFGIARLVGSNRLTATGQFVGTAGYLAPEQVLGGDVGAPADVYALGLVLLECLTGRTEYQGTDVEAAVARLYRPPEIPDDVPADLAALIAAMTLRDPAERPTAAECAAALTPGRVITKKWRSVDLGKPPFPRDQLPGAVVGRGAAGTGGLGGLDLAGRLRGVRVERRGGLVAAAAGAVLVAGLAWTLTTDLHAGQPSPAAVVDQPAEGVGVIRQAGAGTSAGPAATAASPAAVAPQAAIQQSQAAIQQSPAAVQQSPAVRQQASPKKGKKHGDDGDHDKG